MPKLPLVAGLAGLTLVTGCQTHDRVLYDREPVPVRSSSIRLQQTQSVSGDPGLATEADLLPPAPGQTGLEGPTLIP